MRKALLTLGLTIAVGVTGYLASNASTLAQGCQTTCSNAEVRCKRLTGLEKECTAAYRRCLKTGTFTAPKSGTTWTNLCKN
jgi:hypothetical protein